MDLVAGASKFAVNNLGSLLAQEYTLIRGARDDIQYITDELSSMQAFLSRLKRAEHNDEQQEDWMKQVREVAEDIEDHVDYVRLRLGGEPRGRGTAMRLRRAWYLLTTLYARHCIATEIRNLKVRAQHVSERRTRYGVENLACGCRHRSSSSSSSGANTHEDCPAPPPKLISNNQAPVVGLEVSMKELEPWFTQKECIGPGDSRLLAIVGSGGVGKTTLAMALYKKFGDNFHHRAFVVASQKFHLPTFLRSLVKQLHEQRIGACASKSELDGIDEWDEASLKITISKQLQENRYIILIDDIWYVSAWQQIRDSLPRNEMGSKIVVTTRFKSVSEACRREQGYIFEHRPLPVGDSYNLFLEIISSFSYNLCPARPINVGTIMKTCRGLPFAIVLVAGLVASKLRSEPQFNIDHHLVKMDEDLGEALGNNSTPELMTHILSHCYDHLPANLKTCLLYTSMFPKGCLISRKRLIRRWIAERFITKKHRKTIEEVGEECFNELICRNLIQPVYYNSNGKVKSCKIHDMVLEYIVSKSTDENFVTVVGGHWQTPFPSDVMVKVRWLSIHKSGQLEKEKVERMKPSHVRSVMVLGSFQALYSTLVRFQIVEVLDLEDCKGLSIKHLKKICEMRQLKYLSLRRTDIYWIPQNIGNLEYLEVLDIRETNVRKLPATVEKLQRMAHLLAGDKSKRISLRLTEEITNMTVLQTLYGVEIRGTSPGASTGRGAIWAQAPAANSSAEDRHGCCQSRYGCKAVSSGFNEELQTLSTLANLINLKKLTIYKLGRLTCGEEVLLLSAIEHLSCCSLRVLEINDDFSGFLDWALNAWQEPPECLHTLGLSGMLYQVPMWIGSLHNLEKLTLSLTSLTTDTLLVLADLPELFSLIFSLDSTKTDTSVLKILHGNTLKSDGMIFVPAGGFSKLKLLRIAAPVLPPLSFLEGAMPGLQRIELRFRMVEGVYGLENLSSIQQVVLTISSQAPEDGKEKVSQVKKLTSMIHGKVNVPSVLINEYNEPAE